MNRLLRISCCLCLALTVASFGALLLGRAQPVPNGITQLHLADCAPPCWIGIIPGVTTIEDAKARIIAAYSGLRIKDTASFPGGYSASTAVDNEIEGEHFYLFVRLTTSALVDGKSETVQSISLLASREDRVSYAPTVADILGTFGAPQGVWVEDVTNSRRKITLEYAGLDAVFYISPDRRQFAENPRIYFQLAAAPFSTGAYHPWRGLSVLTRSG